jgi:hypothetical protein
MSAPVPPPTTFDAAHWQRINAALDQLLDLDATGQAARLTELENTDPALAVGC